MKCELKLYTVLCGLMLCAAAHAQDFWEQSPGSPGGVIEALAFSPNDHLFAALESTGGVFRSSDYGASWVRFTSGLPGVMISPILGCAPDGRVFVTIGEGGLYGSSDDGNTWTELRGGLPTKAKVGPLDFGPAGGIFAGVEYDLNGIYHHSVFRSIDQGLTWVLTGMLPARVRSLAIGPAAHFFAGTSAGLYRSTNEGSTWEQLFSGSFITAMAIQFTPQNHLVAVAKRSTPSPANVHLSTDAGSTWSHLCVGCPQAQVTTALAVNTAGHIFVGSEEGGIYRSTDDGENWEPINTGLTNNHVTSFAIAASGQIFAGTYGGGIVREKLDTTPIEPLASWEPTDGPQQGPVLSLVATPSGEVFAGSSQGGVFFSADKGETWEPRNNNLNWGYIKFMELGPQGGLYVCGGDHIFHSSNQGADWQIISNGLPKGPYASQNMSAFGITAQGNILVGYVTGFLGGGGGIYRSKNLGATWELFAFEQRKIVEIDVAPSGRIFVSSTSNFNGVSFSDDEGGTWTSTGIGLGSPFGPISEFAFGSKGHVFAGSSERFYCSTNNGDSNSWVVFLRGTKVLALATNEQGHVLRSSPVRLYLSKTNGGSWLDFNAGLPDIQINCFAVAPDGNLYAGGSDGIVYRNRQYTTSVQEKSSSFSPSALALHQNYPNPFNPTTTIRFSLPRSGPATLRVYDTLGEEITTLVSGNLPAGEHQVKWTAENLGAGIYLYRLQTGNMIITRKLVLLR